MHPLRIALVPFSWLYGAVIAIRNRCYDTGIFPVAGVETPVISVGNVTTGGTGKTPLVEYIVGRLIGAGSRPAILSRGYGRSTKGTLTVSDGSAILAGADRAGDEPAQMARKFPGCAVVVDEDRVRGARYLESRFRPDVIVCDDAFQHRALRRDLDIVVLGDDGPDGAAGGGHRLLPAGNGREPLGSLRRADIVVLNQPRERPYRGPAGKPLVRMWYEAGPLRLHGPAGETIATDVLRSGRFVAFSGIGNPDSFAATLGDLGLNPDETLVYPDHHPYGGREIGEIQEALNRSGARYVVTTEKDAVRLDGGRAHAPAFGGRLVVAPIAALMTEGGETLDRAVIELAGRRGA